ncbi:MAG: hypothetical protein Q4D99_05135 [Bacillota bacterium]|nr:hypothetical protein [Bacillota bacterium]
MIILSPSEKPTDPEYIHSMRTSDGRMAWLTPNERFGEGKSLSEMEDDDLREAIISQIPVWQELADSYKGDPNWWPVKHASVEFWTLDEGKFVIGPGIIEGDWHQYCFERVEREIENFLIDCGVLFTNYTGMMD